MEKRKDGDEFVDTSKTEQKMKGDREREREVHELYFRERWPCMLSKG